MRNLAGNQSCVAIQLSDFGKDFMLEPLVHATSIITDENDVGTYIDKAANLKAIITNDVVHYTFCIRLMPSYKPLVP